MTLSIGTPSPEAVADALEVAKLGGDLPRLAAVCIHQAALHDGEGRQRLLEGAAALRWAERLLTELVLLEEADSG